MRKTIVAGAIIAVIALASLTPAQAADMHHVQGPLGDIAGWTVPATAIRPGDSLTFTNLDAKNHDFVAGSRGVPLIGPDQDWCGPIAGFAPGTCPLFWSPLIGLARSAPVYGLGVLTPGSTYPFYCTLHPNMTGTLVVSPV